jgi:hypothetical protein
MHGTNGNPVARLIFHVCIFAFSMGTAGRAVGIEHIGALVDSSIVNVRKHHAQMLDSGRVVLMQGDGRKGYPQLAPYNAIHVGAAAPSIPQDVCIVVFTHLFRRVTLFYSCTSLYS